MNISDWLEKLKNVLGMLEEKTLWGDSKDYFLRMPRNRLHDVETLAVLRRYPKVAAYQLAQAQAELRDAWDAITQAEKLDLPIQIVG